MISFVPRATRRVGVRSASERHIAARLVKENLRARLISNSRADKATSHIAIGLAVAHASILVSSAVTQLRVPRPSRSFT